ncbi:MAG: 1-acyl-sn-glycerol-3-phosphate acyltransferase [Chloroflexi bacterium]|nr:1-acyl-sn-glycerol-3-phosphate acyltransferase [Chloroflexota bacterium]
MASPSTPELNPAAYRRWISAFWTAAPLVMRGVVVEGAEHVPLTGRLLLVINHLSYLDTPIVGMAMPRLVTPIVGERFEHSVFTPVLTAAGSIYINRGEVDRTALRRASAVLENEGCLAVAVEGQRSPTGALTHGKPGAAFLATRTGSPIVPAAIWGTERILPALKRLRRAEVHVRFGEPFRLPHGRIRGAELDHHTEYIMRQLAALLPERYRGVYSHMS